MAKQNNQNGEPQCHKKQVRRRLQTSRPYQDKHLNMAEARKEIVTALKFHRASMRKANEKNQPLPPPQPQLSLLVDQHSQYRYNRSILGMQNENSCENLFTTIPFNMSQNSCRISNDDISNHVSNYHASTSIDPSTIYKTLDVPLPPLGLNLNLQAITNLCTSSMNTSTSSPSSSSSWIPTNLAPTIGVGQAGPSSEMDQVHQDLDDVEIAKVGSIGQKHQMEWDDTLDSVKSNRWFKFLKSLDISREMKGVENNEHDNYNGEYHGNPFDVSMEFPSWLSANDNEESFLKQHLDDQYFSTDYGKDDALPWVDIGDIDGLDDEWLS